MPNIFYANEHHEHRLYCLNQVGQPLSAPVLCSNIVVTVGLSEDQDTKVITAPGQTTDLVCPAIMNKDNWD